VQKCKFGLSFAKLFSGDIDFAKPRLIFQKRIFGFGFRPAGGVWGGMRGGFFFGFLAGGHEERKYIILKSRQSRDTIGIVLDPPSRSRTNLLP
jgi:hypothetical protein